MGMPALSSAPAAGVTVVVGASLTPLTVIDTVLVP
jgi:hypothetical protein